MAVLDTERLTLRPFRMEDLEAFHAYAQNPKIGPNAGWSAHESIAESRMVLKGFIGEATIWAIVRKNEDWVIGSVGLHRDRLCPYSSTRMLGYVLDEACWGLGYATEAARRVLLFAFEELKLSMVSIYHFAHNDRSRRVVEKCSFIRDGILSGAVFHPDGFVADEVCYSLTQEEYRQIGACSRLL